jgi:hypothetical protein
MSLCQHFRRVGAVFANMHLGQADAWAEALLGQPIADPSEDVLSERLAAHTRGVSGLSCRGGGLNIRPPWPG